MSNSATSSRKIVPHPLLQISFSLIMCTVNDPFHDQKFTIIVPSELLRSLPHVRSVFRELNWWITSELLLPCTASPVIKTLILCDTCTATFSALFRDLNSENPESCFTCCTSIGYFFYYSFYRCTCKFCNFYFGIISRFQISLEKWPSVLGVSSVNIILWSFWCSFN